MIYQNLYQIVCNNQQNINSWSCTPCEQTSLIVRCWVRAVVKWMNLVCLKVESCVFEIQNLPVFAVHNYVILLGGGGEYPHR